jgi:hypothetical protein
VNNLFTNLHTTLTQQILHFICLEQKSNPLYIYIKKDGNPSTISTRHVKANVNTHERKTKTIKRIHKRIDVWNQSQLTTEPAVQCAYREKEDWCDGHVPHRCKSTTTKQLT